MFNRYLSGALFAFLLISLGFASPVLAKAAADDPDGGDEIAVATDPDGGDEKGTKATINDTVGAAAGNEIADDPDGGDEVSKVRTSDKKHAEAMNFVKS
jgi:hypothetical protein